MKEITSTMAGTVLTVFVTAGDTIEAGQVVLMLESMKMEIPIESEWQGQVAEVFVNVGDFVNEGDQLLTIG